VTGGVPTLPRWLVVSAREGMEHDGNPGELVEMVDAGPGPAVRVAIPKGTAHWFFALLVRELVRDRWDVDLKQLARAYRVRANLSGRDWVYLDGYGLTD
jgi:hypothetical protein